LVPPSCSMNIYLVYFKPSFIQCIEHGLCTFITNLGFRTISSCNQCHFCFHRIHFVLGQRCTNNFDNKKREMIPFLNHSIINVIFLSLLIIHLLFLYTTRLVHNSQPDKQQHTEVLRENLDILYTYYV